MNFVRNPKDVLSGLLFIALGGLFAWQAWDLPMGAANRMGPGYFPMVLSAGLALLGVAVLVGGLTSEGAKPNGTAWRALAILTVAIVFFGFAMRPLGFIPAIAITVFLSTVASQKFQLTAAIASTAIMTVFTWAVFILGLGLPLPLLGPWLGGH